jgi:hypothetical protein
LPGAEAILCHKEHKNAESEIKKLNKAFFLNLAAIQLD